MLKPCLTFLRLYCVRAMPHGVYLTEMSSSCSRVLTDYDEGFSTAFAGTARAGLVRVTYAWYCPKEFFVLHA